MLFAATFAGCGERVETTSGGTGGHGTGGAAAGGQGGSSVTSGGVGGGFATSGGTVTPTGIDKPSDCDHPSQFTCPLCPDCACYCDPDRPAGPEDCLTTADFQCEEYMPEFVTCGCDPSAPDKPEDCQSPQSFTCAVAAPPIGCRCAAP